MTKKTCKVCKSKFERDEKNPLRNWCSVECGYKLARIRQDEAEARKKKKADREHRDRKQCLKTRSEWLREAQAEFNRFIRLRDANLPCISCGRPNDGRHQRHASHYKSRGSSPELAFNELNCHASCSQCNNFLSGNLVPYRVALIKKIGINNVEWLEGPHEPLKLTIEQIKEIKMTYRQKCKDMS